MPQRKHWNTVFYEAHLTFIDWSCSLSQCPPLLFPLSSSLLNCHLFSLTSPSLLFSPPSPVLSLATISFPLFPLPLFFALLCSWFSVLFMKSCSPRVCLNCILQKKKKKKKHHKTPALASHNSPNAISLDFVCLHDSVGLFVVFRWSSESWAIFFVVAYLFTFNSMLHPRFLCSLTYKRRLLCVSMLYHTPTVSLYLLLNHFGLFPSWLLLTGSHAFPVHSHMWKSEGRSGSGWFRLGRYLGLEWVDIQPNGIFSLSTHTRKHTHAHKQNHLNR